MRGVEPRRLDSWMSSQDGWVESGVGGSTVRSNVGPGGGTSEVQNLDHCNFSQFWFLIFLWVEHVWSSGRVRRRRDVDKLNMSGMIRMWSERGKRDGKCENIKGNALVPDLRNYLTLACGFLHKMHIRCVNLGVPG